ncbi:ABC transporter substrate-binding protein, partial [Streptomyces sp. DT225]
STTAHRIAQAVREGAAGAPPAHGPGAARTPADALRSWAVAHGTDEEAAEEEQEARDDKARAAEAYATEQSGLRAYVVRKSLEPAYTQLALNGETGPLADDRVRRAVARALDRQELADTVLRPLGLPAQPLGSHLAVAGQPAYRDGSDALGKQDTEQAQALLADAGWTREGALSRNDGAKAGSEGEKQEKGAEKKADEKKGSAGKDADDGKADRAAPAGPADDGLYIVGDDDKPGDTGALALAAAPALADGGADRSFTIEDPRITESSGLAASRLHPGIYWTHNDSDDGPYVFAVDSRTGKTVATITMKGVGQPR